MTVTLLFSRSRLVGLWAATSSPAAPTSTSVATSMSTVAEKVSMKMSVWGSLAATTTLRAGEDGGAGVEEWGAISLTEPLGESRKDLLREGCGECWLASEVARKDAFDAVRHCIKYCTQFLWCEERPDVLKRRYSKVHPFKGSIRVLPNRMY